MKRTEGFTLIEVVVGVSLFLLFALGIYGALSFVFKVVYQSRLTIIQTALVSEELETVRNLSFDDVGLIGGVPSGVLAHNKIVIRNGISFSVTTTIRNIDDVFDGTLGGSPNDTAPADYKSIDISSQCLSCAQRKSVALSTRISPKNLEGASANGALFINVFDANGLPVSGANVHIVAPNLVIDDVTDSTGYLRIIDTPTGTMSYAISVTKSGFSTDTTIAPSVANPYPTKLPSNVASRTITDISFSIDQLGALSVNTKNPACVAVGSVPFTLSGSKLIGTSPNVYKYNNTSLSTDGSGVEAISNVEWDTYTANVSGVTYDVAGTIPMGPWSIAPSMHQDVTMLVVPHTSRTLLVKVKDAGTGLPLSDATVSLTGTGYDEIGVTGLGYIRQTDWSGGSGQVSYSDESEYFSDDGAINENSPAGDLKLRRVGSNYLTSGWLESSTFDFGAAVDFNNVIIDPISQPTQVGSQSVLMQVATSNSSTPALWDYTGPDGTASTYYTPTNTLMFSGLSDNRYLRYTLFLATANQSYTPQVSEIAFTYTTNCAAPGQTFFDGMSAGSFTLNVTRNGYATINGLIDVAGNMETVVNMSPL